MLPRKNADIVFLGELSFYSTRWYPKWRLYGALGVRVCDRGLDFDCFMADVAERPSPKHSIDRYSDCWGNYEPGNVRWAWPNGHRSDG
jgi:hypothetical protein